MNSYFYATLDLGGDNCAKKKSLKKNGLIVKAYNDKHIIDSINEIAPDKSRNAEKQFARNVLLIKLIWVSFIILTVKYSV